MVNKLFVRDVIKQGQVYCTQRGNTRLSYSTLHLGTGIADTTNPYLVDLVEKILGKWNYRSAITHPNDNPDVENVVVVPVLDAFYGFGTWGDDEDFNISNGGDGFFYNNWNFVLHPTGTSPNDSPTNNIFCLLGCILDPDGSDEYILAIKPAPQWIQWENNTFESSYISSLSTISQLISSESYNITVSAKYQNNNIKYTRNLNSLFVGNESVLRIGYSIPKMISELVESDGNLHVGNTYWELADSYYENSYGAINLLSYIDGNTGIPYNYQSQEISFNSANLKPQTFFFDQSSTSDPVDSDIYIDDDIGTVYITPLQYTGQQDLPDITYIADIVPEGETFYVYEEGFDIESDSDGYLLIGTGFGFSFDADVETIKQLFSQQNYNNHYNNYYNSETKTWYFRSLANKKPDDLKEEFTGQLITSNSFNNPTFMTIRCIDANHSGKYYLTSRFYSLAIADKWMKDNSESLSWIVQNNNKTWKAQQIPPKTLLDQNVQMTLQAYNTSNQQPSNQSQFGSNTNITTLPSSSSLSLESMPELPSGKGYFYISKLHEHNYQRDAPIIFHRQRVAISNNLDFNRILDFYFGITDSINIIHHPVYDNALPSIGKWNIEYIYSNRVSRVGSKYKISYWDISNLTSLDNAFNTTNRPNASTFNLSLNAWNTSSITSLVETFKGTQNFNQPLWVWDTSKVTDFTGLFKNAIGITGPISSSTSVDSVSDMGTSLRYWKVDESAILTDMFDGAINYTSTSQYFGTTPSYQFFNYIIRASSLPFAGSNFTVDIIDGIDANGNLTIETTLEGTGLIGSQIANILLEAHREGVIPYFANIAEVDSSQSFSKPLKISTTEVMFGVIKHTNGEYILAVSSDAITSSNQTQEVSLYDHDKISGADFESIQTGITFPGDEDDMVTDDQLKLYLGPNVVIDNKTYRIISVWSPLTRSENRYTPFSDANLKHAISYYFGSTLSLPHGIHVNATTVGRFSDTKTRSAIQYWNTSKLTSMKNAFNQSAAQSYNFNENLSNWDFSNVTNAEGLFKDNTNFDNGGKDPFWDTSVLINASHMFQGCSSFNRDLSSMIMSNVTTTSHMFYNATKYEGTGIGDGWDLQSCTDMTSMFEGASSFNQYLSWGIGTRSHLKRMFKNASSFRNGFGSRFFSSFGPLYLGDTSSVTDFTSMFEGATSFDWPGRIELHLDSATTTEAMFANTPNMYGIIQGHLRSDGTETFYTGNVTNMSRMFESSAVLEVHLNTDSVTTMEAMFKNAIGSPITKVFDLVSHVIGNAYYTWNTANVTNFSEMFSGANTFNGDLSSFDTSSGEDFSQMFKNATIYNQDITGWDVSSSQDMSEMFSGASALRQNIRLWTPEPTTSFTNMFQDSTEMVKNYRGTTGWLSGSTPTIEFFDPTESYIFKIPDGSSFGEEINYLGKGNIHVPDLGTLEKVEILSSAESNYFELTKNTQPLINRIAIAEGTQKHCLEPQARSKQYTSIGNSVIISDLDGIGISLRSKELLYYSTNTNYDVDLLYTFSNGKTTNIHIEIDVFLRSTNCQCRVLSGTEKQASFFSGTMNQPTFMVTNAGLLSTLVNVSRYVGTKRIVPSEPASLNAFGKREGAPGGSGAPPRNIF
jgi:hypothetical protein